MNNKSDLDFGKAVRIALEMRNMTRPDLAAKLGRHRSNIDELCRNKERATLITVKAVAGALDMSVSELTALGEV